jgi:quercetin dioxygenase-like cupin family protein
MTATTNATPILEIGGSKVIEHAGGADTNGAVTLLEFVVAPGYPTPPPHVHEREDELTYVIEGALEVEVGGDTRVVRAGETVLKPRGIPHAFRVHSDSGARFLEVLTPAGFEGYFREIADALERGIAPTPELTGPLMGSYGVRAA